MGGFSNFFDRPAPRVTSLVKNPKLQSGIEGMTSDYMANANQSKDNLGDYISKYLAGTRAAEQQNAQETGAIDEFYNGAMDSKLGALRASRSKAMTDAANRASDYALRGVRGNMVANDGGSSSYDTRQAVRNLTDIQTQAALDNANQERQDFGYVTGNRIGLAGSRTGLQDTLARRALMPSQATSDVLRRNEGEMQGLVGLDQANKFYGLKQDPGILDRLRQEQQFVSGLGSLMKDQYGTAAEAYGGWAGAGMGGGGGGGMGGMSGMSMSRGGEIHGPGTETSDSIPARLSEGEFVVPAAAVRMPGVLPWLKAIRAKALALEPQHQPIPGHYESGGLIYANDFGGLGSMAFNYDALNQQSQDKANAAGQQDKQFGQQMGLEKQKMQDQNDREILNRYQSGGRSVPVGGGYMPMGESGGTGAAITAPSMWSRGGLVPRYADGGEVRDIRQSPNMLHELAKEAAYQMMQPGWRSNQQRHMDIEEAHNADWGKRYDAEERVRQRQIKLAEDQFDWTKTQPTPTQLRDDDLTFNSQITAAQNGEDPGDLSIHSPTRRSLIQNLYKAGHERRTADYQQAQADAGILNKADELKAAIKKTSDYIDQGGDRLPGLKWVPIDFEGMKLARQSLKDYQSELDEIKPRAQAVMENNKKTNRLTQHPKTNAWIPAVTPPPAVSSVSAAAALGSRTLNYQPHDEAADEVRNGGVGLQPSPQLPASPMTNAPSLYQRGRRYGNLRYLGGDPNAETSWQPVQAQ